MRIAIYGGGAIGGHVAARLGHAGHAVSIVARGAQRDAIAADGLRLQLGDAVLHTHPAVDEDPRALGPQQVVFVTVKATALAAVADGLAPLVDENTVVVFAQNGMPWWYPVGLSAAHGPLPPLPIFRLADAFLDTLRPDQVIPAVVYSANEVVAPGVVRSNSPGRNVLELAPLAGPAASAAPTLDALRSALVDAGIGSPAVDDIRAAMWLKLIVNATASSLAVATGNPRAPAVDADVGRTFRHIVDECLAVTAALGFDHAARLDVTRWTARPSGHTPSMLQDFEQGRPVELDEIVLAPLAFARAIGIATPTLDAVAAIAVRRCIDRGVYGGHAGRPPASP